MTTMTATERRRRERQEFLAQMEVCASREVLDLLGDRWVTLILHALADGPLRRGQLSRSVIGASPKMLTQTLRSLERDGIVIRSVTADVPVRVEYELSPVGRSVLELVQTIAAWSSAHIDEIRAARRALLARPDGGSGHGDDRIAAGGSMRRSSESD